MVQTDPIADMLTVIRNGLMVKKESVMSHHSKIKEGLLKVLKEEGYLKAFKILDQDTKIKTIKIYLKYGPRGEKIINRVQRVSKPGRRVYSKIDDLPPVIQGLGINILSTSKGILSDREARKQKVGGEVLCKIW